MGGAPSGPTRPWRLGGRLAPDSLKDPRLAQRGEGVLWGSKELQRVTLGALV